MLRVSIYPYTVGGDNEARPHDRGRGTAPGRSRLRPAQARGELKAEIEAKIKKDGVHTFTLDVVPKGEAPKPEASKEGSKEADAKKGGAAAQGKVVGTCDGGTKQIIYKCG